MDRINRIIEATTQFVSWIAEGALFLMMLMTAADVTLRHLFNRPILGSYEITEYLMAIMVPFAIVCTGWLKRHVSVDLFVSRLTSRSRRILDIFNWFLTLGLFILIVRQCFVFTLFTYNDEVKSSVLYIPAYPFVVAIVLGLCLFCIVLIVQLINIILMRIKR